ncbi:MAG: single-stranded DNA-binding protein [Lentisphaeria bacterium]|nr:single-stranded DNA-binding protein [Lentisphaeria bacterium]NLZ60285.1 single-stranded DNA-binding protein [Lentisphaerota bacterium]
MANFNKVFLMGNLTRDPESRQLPSGSTVCNFGMAINRNITLASGEQREDTCYVDLAAFGRSGEVIQQYCRKGSPLFVEGRLRFEQWDDQESGKKRSRLSVVVERQQLLGGSPAQQGGYGGQQQQGGYGGQQQQGGYGTQQQGAYARPAAARPQAAYGQAQPAPPAYGQAPPVYGQQPSASAAPPVYSPPAGNMPAFQPLPEQPGNAPAQDAGQSQVEGGDSVVDDLPF